MKKIHAVIVAAIAAGALALLSVPQQQSFAQYGDNSNSGAGPVGGVSKDTLQKCLDLKIEMAQCTEANVLLKERVGMTEGAGSGTAMIATETGQMVALIGVLGAVFGGVAGAFFVMGKKDRQTKSAS